MVILRYLGKKEGLLKTGAGQEWVKSSPLCSAHLRGLKSLVNEKKTMQKWDLLSPNSQ